MSEPNIERAKALIVEADGGAPWNRFDILALMLTFAKEHATAAVAQAKREGAIEALEQVSAYLEGNVPIRSTPRDEYGSGIEVGYQECIEHLDACIKAIKEAPHGN